MKISRIDVYQIDLPLTQPYFLSGGRLRFDRLDSTLVHVQTTDGLSGWGESCPWGHTYLPAHGAGVRAGIETVAAALIGQDPCALDELNRTMDQCLPGHPYAKSAIDMACWDILGKFTRMPLWRLLGASTPQAVAVNSSISTGTPKAMLALIREASAQGYRTHSAKIGGDDVAADIKRIETITAELPDDELVTFDVNRAWTPAVAIKVLNSVQTSNQQSGIEQPWIEQPCETLQQCVQVAKRVVQPIMLDECLHNFDDHLQAWSLNACEGVKVKPNRLGGLSKARRIRDFGLQAGWQMHIEDVGGTVLADTAAIHLAASTPAAHRLASWLCHYHLSLDPFEGQGARNVNGFATPPSLPGIGVTPDPDKLGATIATYT